MHANPEHVIDLLPAFVLGSLETTEKQQVERHLLECASCRQELLAYQNLVGQIPLAAREFSPPPELKTEILARVEQRRRPRQTAKAATRRPWYTPFLQLTARPVWGVISLILILGLVVSNLLLWQRLQQIQAQRSEHFIQVQLIGAGPAPSAHGLIVISPDGKHGTLVADKLPPLEPSLEYQLWLIHDGQRANGGTFSVKESGYAILYISSPEPLFQYDAFGITIEPAGGSPGPTGEKVLGGNF